MKDSQEWWEAAGDAGGRPVTARVMSHDVIIFGSEVHDFNLGEHRRSRLSDYSLLPSALPLPSQRDGA